MPRPRSVPAASVASPPRQPASPAKRLRREGIIAPSDRVVCVLTGHQLKDPQLTVAYHSADARTFHDVLGIHGISTAPFANRAGTGAQRSGCDHRGDRALILHFHDAAQNLTLPAVLMDGPTLYGPAVFPDQTRANCADGRRAGTSVPQAPAGVAWAKRCCGGARCGRCR